MNRKSLLSQAIKEARRIADTYGKPMCVVHYNGGFHVTNCTDGIPTTHVAWSSEDY